MEAFGWILLLILVLIIGLIIWIIFVPVYIKIDTQNNLFLISQRGTFHLSFTPVQKPHIKVKVLGILVPDSNKPKSKKEKKKKSKPLIKRSIRSWLFLIKALLKSFRVIR